MYDIPRIATDLYASLLLSVDSCSSRGGAGSWGLEQMAPNRGLVVSSSNSLTVG